MAGVFRLTYFEAQASMCEKCVEIDGKIAQYRRLVASITDQLTNDRIGQLIRDLEAAKAQLHPEAKI